MDQFTATRIVRRYRAAHRAPAQRVFGLLCPVREYEWIAVWNCEMIYSTGGFAEEDCVFRTDFTDRGGPQTWTCSHYEPPRRIDYVIVGAHHVTRLQIELEAVPEGGCRSAWTRVYTALDEEGNRLLAAIDEERYRAENSALERMINHYLDTGTCLPLAEAG